MIFPTFIQFIRYSSKSVSNTVLRYVYIQELEESRKEEQIPKSALDYWLKANYSHEVFLLWLGLACSGSEMEREQRCNRTRKPYTNLSSQKRKEKG